MTRVEEVIKEKVMAAFLAFEEDQHQLIDKVREMNYQTNDIVNSRSATKEELEGIYADQKKVRLETYESFTKLYQVASENTTDAEWKAIRKALRKIFKQSQVKRIMNKIR